MPKSGSENGRDKTRSFSVARVEPEMLSREESAAMMLDALEKLQKIERNYIGRDLVEVAVRHNRPIMAITAADLHALSLATDNRRILTLRDFILADPDRVVALLGDEVEGIKEAYLNTNSARTPADFHKQIDWLRYEFLEPLAAEKRIACMVSGYWGHPGWAEDATTLNTWRMMTDGLDIPLLRNGGLLRFVFANGEKHEIEIWHNPPGNSETDSVYGLRRAMSLVSAPVRADGGASAHIHRSGVAKELYPGKVTTYYISTGTLKGSSDEFPPDRFGVKLGKPLTDPLGQGVIVQPAKNGEEARVFPYPSQRHGDVAFLAMELLNAAETQGITEELLEKISKQVEDRPKVTFDADESVVSRVPYESKHDLPLKGGEKQKSPFYDGPMVPPYDILALNIKAKLPVALHLIAKARLGSAVEGKKPLVQFQKDLILNDPYDLAVFLGRMIDHDAGNSPERQEVLDGLVEIINQARGQTLAIMLDECLRQGAWKSEIFSGEYDEYIDEKGKERRRKIFDPAIPPGTYLANETGVPLIHHLSLIKIGVGPKTKLTEKPLYIGAFADKLERSGSITKPTFGLKRLYDLQLHEKPGYVAGGHMPNAGTYVWHDDSNRVTDYPMAIATGWFAGAVDTIGKGNVRPGAMPGQAVIFMPGKNQEDYLAFPTANADESEYLHDALMLLQGLEILGLTNKVLKKK